MPNGDQLPYIDEIQISVVSDAEAGKLQVQQGSVDYCQGGFNQITLNDVQGLRDSAEQAGTEVVFWDSGSGTGSIFFFNYDYVDDDLRELIREPKFRQALSHAFNRDAVQKAIYFNTGELTTGTFSPKAIEYNDQRHRARRSTPSWRDAYVAYDPEKAKAMLDEIGRQGPNGDGMRELPERQKLSLHTRLPGRRARRSTRPRNELDLPTGRRSGSDDEQPDRLPQAFDDEWETGKLMTNSNWEVGDGPNHLVYPQWLVPLEYDPLGAAEGPVVRSCAARTQENQQLDRRPVGAQPAADGARDRATRSQKLWEIYDQTKVEPDAMNRHRLVWEMIKIHVYDGPFWMGSVANYPQVDGRQDGPDERPAQGEPGPRRHRRIPGSTPRRRSTTRRPGSGTTRTSTELIPAVLDRSTAPIERSRLMLVFIVRRLGLRGHHVVAGLAAQLLHHRAGARVARWTRRSPGCESGQDGLDRADRGPGGAVRRQRPAGS